MRHTILAVISTCVAVLLVYVVHQAMEARSAKAMNPCVNNLRNIAAAKEQWRLDHRKPTYESPNWSDILPYMGVGIAGQMPHCPDGGVYTIGGLGETPKCSIGGQGHVLPDPK